MASGDALPKQFESEARPGKDDGEGKDSGSTATGAGGRETGLGNGAGGGTKGTRSGKAGVAMHRRERDLTMFDL
jgi:hypothetical protein